MRRHGTTRMGEASFAFRWLFALALLGCSEVEPRDQWQIHVATDAPVPQLGDRVLAEVLVASGEGLVPCKDCQRQLVADVGERWPISFGVAPVAGIDELWLRLRLYRSTETDDVGLPSPDLAIDLLARLPPAQGVTDVAAVLAAACVGIPSDVESRATCDPSTSSMTTGLAFETSFDEVALPAPGSWSPSTRVDCPGDPPHANMRCIPGGLLILGSSVFLPVLGEPFVSLPERLVQVSPFWMDVDEMTVGEIKALFDVVPQPTMPACLFDPDSSENDAHSMNCVPFDFAEAACEARGKRLPTEAQWEHAASNAGRETEFPFPVTLVSSESLCNHAVVATAAGDGFSACRAKLGTGPRPGGHDGDVNDFGIRNLGGNLSEWVRDAFVPYSDPTCWGEGPELLEDPLCESSVVAIGIRGGSWRSAGALARAATRNGNFPAMVDEDVGIRCVAPATPAK
jgi:formylglycine-generating enzyme